MGLTVQSSKTEQTVRDHLRELRSRLVVCVLVYIAIGVGLLFVYEPILKVLSSSLGSELYYSNPAGGFSFIMRICSTGALIFTIPVIVFNLIKFTKPACEKILTNKRIALVSIFSTALAALGAAFAFYIILPETINFFGGFQVGGLSALINADQYLGFITSMIAVFAIIFQVPLVMLLIDNIKNIPPKNMLKMEKWVIVISIVVAIITPFNYDILSSLVVAVPIIGLYNLSILIVILNHKITAFKNSRMIHAVVVKPAAQLDFLISDINIAEFNDELKVLDKQTIIYSHPTKTPPLKSQAIDFKRQNISFDEVKPAAWVEEKKRRRLALNTKVKVFSDVIPVRSNRILA